MSKRRKDGQGSRYQQDGGPHPLSESLIEMVPDLALAQLFRQTCSACGSRVLRWFTGAEAGDVLGTGGAVEMLSSLPAGYRAIADCWQCLRCGEAGCFGPSEWEPW